MLVQDEGVVQKGLQLGQEATEQVAGSLWADHTARPLGQRELILDVHDLTDVVQDFEAMDEFAPLLRVVQTRNHVRQELVLYAEVALEVQVEKLEELVL